MRDGLEAVVERRDHLRLGPPPVAEQDEIVPVDHDHGTEPGEGGCPPPRIEVAEAEVGILEGVWGRRPVLHRTLRLSRMQGDQAGQQCRDDREGTTVVSAGSHDRQAPPEYRPGVRSRPTPPELPRVATARLSHRGRRRSAPSPDPASAGLDPAPHGRPRRPTTVSNPRDWRCFERSSEGSSPRGGLRREKTGIDDRSSASICSASRRNTSP